MRRTKYFAGYLITSTNLYEGDDIQSNVDCACSLMLTQNTLEDKRKMLVINDGIRKCTVLQ
jgi:hypothetical protein